jgi:hypothetical protein
VRPRRVIGASGRPLNFIVRPHMSRDAPPPVLVSARVLSYAFVDDIPYRRSRDLYVDGKLLEQVPRLAICSNLGEEFGAMMLDHCGWLRAAGAGRQYAPKGGHRERICRLSRLLTAPAQRR